MKTLGFAVVISVSSLLVLSTGADARPAYKCHKKITPKNVIKGNNGKYEIKQGLQTRKQNGFLGRSQIKVQNKCFIPDLRSDDCVLVHLPKKAFEAGHSRWKMQCVLSDNPGKLITSSMRGALNSTSVIDGYKVLTKCPNSTGYKCSDGDNRNRSRRLEKELAKKDLVMRSFCVPRSHMRAGKNVGKKVFCQWLDPQTSTVLFATEYLFEGSK
jgi:hypothetical protein